MKSVISVIVPVYNVAAYLPQCLDSILGQDYEALEVLVVDDGSTDGSGALCDQYARQDSRVRVVHQKNAGAAAAKNAALDLATGEYLSFVDSDDYLEPNVYGVMVALMQEHQADAAQFNFREVYRTHTQDQRQWQGRGVMNSRTYLGRFPEDFTCALLWNKLYRREIYQGVRFVEGHKIDDEFFTYRGFLKERKIVWDERIVYNYRKRRSSVMASPQAAEQRLLDAAQALDRRRHEVAQAWPELKRAFDRSYLDALWYLSGNAIHEETVSELQKCLRRYLLTVGNTPPSRYLLGRLFRVLITRPQQIVMARKENQVEDDSVDYFM